MATQLRPCSFNYLITELQKESEKAIGWFSSNKMVVNPDKFHSIIINWLGNLKDSYKLLTDNHEIDSENSVTLLGIELDNNIIFVKHAALFLKAGRQLNALPRIHKYIGFQEMEMLLDSFIFSNFTYYPLV